MYALAKYYEWAAAASKRKARYDAIEAKLAATCGVEAPSKTGGTKNGGSGAFDDPMDLTMDESIRVVIRSVCIIIRHSCERDANERYRRRIEHGTHGTHGARRR